MNRLASSGALLSVALSPLAHATNGMNLEAYGAKAAGLGGAAMAYDSGNSAVMNNPATLGLKSDGRSDFGLGLTVLMPKVEASHPDAGTSRSNADAYYMPSLSWIQRNGALTYGVAMISQGGMGTEYGAGASLFAGGVSMMGNPARLSGEDIRSEVGFGRLMFPLAWQATERLTLAGQVDAVWATMDVRMDLDGQSFGRMVAGDPKVGRASGSLVGAFKGAMSAGMVSDVNYARFDFSDDNDFSGAARGFGAAFKLGAVYRATDTLSIGASYHSKSKISDLKAGSATVQMGVNTPAGAMDVAVNGKIRVEDFQWPETLGVGLAWNATPQLMLVADLKFLRWSRSMKDFTLRFDADSSQDNPLAAGLVGMGGTRLDASMPQNWKDQTVAMIGAQYMLTPGFALRAGASHAENPVSSAHLNPLFPAIVTTHYAVGFGWRASKEHSLAAALTIVPTASQTNSENGVTARHSQHSLRISYNYSY